MSITSPDITNRFAAGATSAPSAADERGRIAARKVAAEFESLLLAQLTRSLNPSPDDEDADLFRSDAGDAYRSMFGEQFAASLAKNGGIGLADKLVDRILPAQAGDRLSADRPAPSGVNHAIDAARSVRAANALARLPSDPSDPVIISQAANEEAEAMNQTSTSSRANERFVEYLRALDAAMPASSDSTGTGAAVFSATNARPDAHAAAPPNANAAAAEAGEAEMRLAPSAPERVALHAPVAGRVTSGFGTRVHPILGTHKHHDGVDIAAPRGTPIGAAAAGTVRFAGRQGGYGNTVVIEHADGRTTRYAHADRLLVAEGDIVAAGQTIATVGSTGRSTGPHLHFEVSENGRRTDPLRAMNE